MRIINLTRGYQTIVDEDMFDELKRFSWYAAVNQDGSVYAARTIKHGSNKQTIFMHQQVMNAPQGQLVDHADRNGLNNQKQNLRYCTKSQNAANSTIKNLGKIPYRGVSKDKDKKKYRAYIKYMQKRYHIGYFSTPEAAALAYNKKALEFWGEFASLNKVSS